MTFADLEHILRQAARRYAADEIISEVLESLAQDIRDLIEAEKAEAKERSE